LSSIVKGLRIAMIEKCSPTLGIALVCCGKSNPYNFRLSPAHLKPFSPVAPGHSDVSVDGCVNFIKGASIVDDRRKKSFHHRQSRFLVHGRAETMASESEAKSSKTTKFAFRDPDGVIGIPYVIFCSNQLLYISSSRFLRI
jgi:hypothetical protein